MDTHSILAVYWRADKRPIIRTSNVAKTKKLGEVERVYQLLREWLISVKLTPGEFLSEPGLAMRCKTSRTPIREACTRLMQDKWLSRIPRKGFMVTPISVRDIVELYEYRKLLECFTAKKVAQSASQDQLAELRQIIRPETSRAADLIEILRSNERFHLRLAEMAGNQRVISQLSLTLSYVSRLDTLCTQTVPGWIGHAEILCALEARQSLKAWEAMEAHIDLSRDKMIKLFSA
jgi:DNA-binding GntR family transcriptional regulator